MDYRQAASRLSELLGLDRVPIGLAFVDGPVDGIEHVDRQVPSACTFWRLAAERCFYAPARDHFNCPVGAATMGFDLPAEVADQLGEAVELMAGAAYFDPGEVPHLPRVEQSSEGIIYGPLAELPVPADAVLVWMSPRSAMVFAEAQGDGRWDAIAATRLLGRPGCAAIPTAAETGTALSFGCAGMRTFTEIADSHLLGVIAGTRLEAMLTDLESTRQANATMLDYYEGRAAAFTP
jgi:uncharacterized protein (DUF169 family)